ncbi:hypothetical protein BC832DRAFT_545521 [Gaertneriomyces semiglobifer]|nr:hypothetical protein BC832DRAFT_545521 [Gaertneriomyces semiglobifer]
MQIRVMCLVKHCLEPQLSKQQISHQRRKAIVDGHRYLKSGNLFRGVKPVSKVSEHEESIGPVVDEQPRYYQPPQCFHRTSCRQNILPKRIVLVSKQRKQAILVRNYFLQIVSFSTHVGCCSEFLAPSRVQANGVICEEEVTICASDVVYGSIRIQGLYCTNSSLSRSSAFSLTARTKRINILPIVVHDEACASCDFLRFGKGESPVVLESRQVEQLSPSLDGGIVSNSLHASELRLTNNPFHPDSKNP